MSEPKLEYKIAYAVDCHDLDKFVNMHLAGYGKSWRSLDTGNDGYHNGSYQSATVEIGAEVEDDEDQDFGRWLLDDGPFYLDTEGPYSYDSPDIQHMLQWLCNIGKIPEGHYVIELWW